VTAVTEQPAATRRLNAHRAARTGARMAPLFGLPFSPPAGYVSFSDWNTAWESVKAS